MVLQVCRLRQLPHNYVSHSLKGLIRGALPSVHLPHGYLKHDTLAIGSPHGWNTGATQST